MDKGFEVEMSGGIVKEVFVSKDMSMEDENLLKGILGSLQQDTSERNMVNEKQKFYDEGTISGSYKKMEEDVTGRCEVLIQHYTLRFFFSEQIFQIELFFLDILLNHPIGSECFTK